MAGDADRKRPVVDRAEQNLEIVADHLVERRGLGPMPCRFAREPSLHCGCSLRYSWQGNTPCTASPTAMCDRSWGSPLIPSHQTKTGNRARSLGCSTVSMRTDSSPKSHARVAFGFPWPVEGPCPPRSSSGGGCLPGTLRYRRLICGNIFAKSEETTRERFTLSSLPAHFQPDRPSGIRYWNSYLALPDLRYSRHGPAGDGHRAIRSSRGAADAGSCERRRLVERLRMARVQIRPPLLVLAPDPRAVPAPAVPEGPL